MQLGARGSVVSFVSGGAFHCTSVSSCCGAIGVCGFDGRFLHGDCIPFLRTCDGTLNGGRCCRRMLQMVALLREYRLGKLPLRKRH